MIVATITDLSKIKSCCNQNRITGTNDKITNGGSKSVLIWNVFSQENCIPNLINMRRLQPCTGSKSEAGLNILNNASLCDNNISVRFKFKPVPNRFASTRDHKL